MRWLTVAKWHLSLAYKLALIDPGQPRLLHNSSFAQSFEVHQLLLSLESIGKGAVLTDVEVATWPGQCRRWALVHVRCHAKHIPSRSVRAECHFFGLVGAVNEVVRKMLWLVVFVRRTYFGKKSASSFRFWLYEHNNITTFRRSAIKIDK